MNTCQKRLCVLAVRLTINGAIPIVYHKQDGALKL